MLDNETIRPNTIVAYRGRSWSRPKVSGAGTLVGLPEFLGVALG
jgi:hypothetical protein